MTADGGGPVHYQQQVLAPVPRPDFGTGFCAQSTPNAILPGQAGFGALWVTNGESHGSVSRINPATGTVTAGARSSVSWSG